MERSVEQFNGRGARAASLQNRFSEPFTCVSLVFALRHLSRYKFQTKRREQII